MTNIRNTYRFYKLNVNRHGYIYIGTYAYTGRYLLILLKKSILSDSISSLTYLLIGLKPV